MCCTRCRRWRRCGRRIRTGSSDGPLSRAGATCCRLPGDPEDLSQGVGRVLPARRWSTAGTALPTREWKQKPLARGTLLEIRALSEVLRDERFDVCVDMQGAIKSAGGGTDGGGGCPGRVGEPQGAGGELVLRQEGGHAGRACGGAGVRAAGRAVGEVLQPARVTLPMDEKDELWADEVVGRERFCLISPGAGWGAKMWPAERLGQVAAELGRAGVRSVVNASVRGSREANAVVAHSEGYARAVPCTVGQLIALVRRAAVVIAGDTGPLHLAAALERPVVGIYGPTDPARNGPYGTRRGCCAMRPA